MNKIGLVVLCFSLIFSQSLTFLDYRKSISPNNNFSKFIYKPNISNETAPGIFDKMICYKGQMISIEEYEKKNKKDEEYKKCLRRLEAYSIITTGYLRVYKFLKSL